MRQKYIHSSNQTNEFESESLRYISSGLSEKKVLLQKNLFKINSQKIKLILYATLVVVVEKI